MCVVFCSLLLGNRNFISISKSGLGDYNAARVGGLAMQQTTN